jgi:ribosomal protein S18 acetylase RimI-like enzyme
MEIELRAVGPDDPGAQALVSALRREVFERKAREDIDDGPRENPTAMALAGDSLIVVAYEGDEPAGMAALAEFGPGVAEIKWLYVAPAYRRAGLARRLLTTVEERARERGFDTVRLDTHERLTEADGLYRSAAYREIGNYNGSKSANRWFEKSLREFT